ncbi:hypothetical protein HCN51_36815 [Nonomuraea sp. FMUSA5-5]|uniref:Uncharacterized protein n=1 Tax=Nonomuraea composti TaxID=2720023 RepID=A0ABX1BAX2_9ACTN|nr:hypothetical protein [Nonomuraea sp. FMUSA5-5]NJP94935.1 hypothetical protein [Nonomuraea sp. FMUSA5-5]
MSYLRNPSFEAPDIAPWTRMNQAAAVQYKIWGTSDARSGGAVLVMSTSQMEGSVCQDFTATGPPPSISCFAWVRSASQSPVKGSLAIWDLGANRSVAARFTATPEWRLVTCTMDTAGSGLRQIRVEFYLRTINHELWVDSVNAF